MINILIDSDILLDFYLQRQPFINESLQVLIACESGKANGFVTALALSNTHYILRKNFENDVIMRNFKKLLIFLDITITPKEAVLKSIESNFSDFEDALQNFSSENQGNINTIITRNIKDYKKSNLSILTPNMFLKTL